MRSFFSSDAPIIIALIIVSVLIVIVMTKMIKIKQVEKKIDQDIWQKELEIQKRKKERKRQRKLQLDHVCYASKKIQSLNALNNSFSPFHISPVSLQCTCKTKREFDHTDLRGFLISQMESDPAFYQDLLNKTEQNAALYHRYTDQFNSILNEVSSEEWQLYAQYPYFRQMEADICRNLLKNPYDSVSVHIEKTYTSEQGRNFYRDSDSFFYDDVKDCLQTAFYNIDSRSGVQYERQRMTPSLRYDVMKRDGFRCVLCGASQKDGVRLHVDHIKPVSKGGKTEMTNLRTLCESCNRGKGAKYDEYGPN